VQNLQGTDPTDNTGGYGISGVFFKLNVADQTGTSGNAELQQDPNPIVTVEVVGEEGGYLTGTWFNPLFENVPGGCDTDCYVSFDNERGAFPGPNLVAGCDSVPLNGPNPPFLYTIGSWSTCPKDLGDDWVTFTDDVIIVNALADAPPLTASDISDVEWNEAVPGGGSYLGYGSVPGSNSFPDVSVTPEPETIALLATGLAGMGGLGVFRRKRSHPAGGTARGNRGHSEEDDRKWLITNGVLAVPEAPSDGQQAAAPAPPVQSVAPRVNPKVS